MRSQVVCLFCSVLLLIRFHLSSSIHITSEDLLDRIQCIETCHRLNHRKCRAPPDDCGECMHNYENILGECQPHPVSKLEVHKPEFKPDSANSVLKVSEETGDAGNAPVIRNAAQMIQEINLPVIEKKDAPSPPGSAPTPPDLASTTTRAHPNDTSKSIIDDDLQIVIIGVLIALAICLVAVIVIAVSCYCCKPKEVPETKSGMDYPPAYSKTVYNDSMRVPGDRKLAYSAQMYHYQHQKQQMLESERANEVDSKNGSGANSDEEAMDEQVIYECPGLATTGELEVTNPYYSESPMPSYVNGHHPGP